MISPRSPARPTNATTMRRRPATPTPTATPPTDDADHYSTNPPTATNAPPGRPTATNAADDADYNGVTNAPRHQSATNHQRGYQRTPGRLRAPRRCYRRATRHGHRRRSPPTNDHAASPTSPRGRSLTDPPTTNGSPATMHADGQPRSPTTMRTSRTKPTIGHQIHPSARTRRTNYAMNDYADADAVGVRARRARALTHSLVTNYVTSYVTSPPTAADHQPTPPTNAATPTTHG